MIDLHIRNSNVAWTQHAIQKFEERCPQLLSPAVWIARILNPTAPPLNIMIQHVIHHLKNFVLNLNREKCLLLETQLLNFIAHTNGFDDSLFLVHTDPITWWKLMKKNAPELSELALDLMSLPCSTASSEHAWKVVASILDKKCNRLSIN
eukprot:TRINITY_DN11184_c0_g1_i1.p1 TRINITY_DN11184_c0_g1~~TRINITY_DN11184_c0_g1_i1.p1  ORF type:complete len:150 (-),score=8.38 TRINITY_DN11184_c0_g1_i1:49-498(-)